MQPLISPQALQALMSQHQGGSIERYRHSLVRSFIYSEGLRDVAQAAGAYWLIDILATEVAPLVMKSFKADESALGIVTLDVTPAGAKMTLSLNDEALPAWSRTIDFTTFPEGSWNFYIGIDELESGYITTGFIPAEY